METFNPQNQEIKGYHKTGHSKLYPYRSIICLSTLFVHENGENERGCIFVIVRDKNLKFRKRTNGYLSGKKISGGKRRVEKNGFPTGLVVYLVHSYI